MWWQQRFQHQQRDWQQTHQSYANHIGHQTNETDTCGNTNCTAKSQQQPPGRALTLVKGYRYTGPSEEQHLQKKRKKEKRRAWGSPDPARTMAGSREDHPVTSLGRGEEVNFTIATNNAYERTITTHVSNFGTENLDPSGVVEQLNKQGFKDLETIQKTYNRYELCFRTSEAKDKLLTKGMTFGSSFVRFRACGDRSLPVTLVGMAPEISTVEFLKLFCQYADIERYYDVVKTTKSGYKYKNGNRVFMVKKFKTQPPRSFTINERPARLVFTQDEKNKHFFPPGTTYPKPGNSKWSEEDMDLRDWGIGNNSNEQKEQEQEEQHQQQSHKPSAPLLPQLIDDTDITQSWSIVPPRKPKTKKTNTKRIVYDSTTEESTAEMEEDSDSDSDRPTSEQRTPADYQQQIQETTDPNQLQQLLKDTPKEATPENTEEQYNEPPPKKNSNSPKEQNKITTTSYAQAASNKNNELIRVNETTTKRDATSPLREETKQKKQLTYKIEVEELISNCNAFEKTIMPKTLFTQLNYKDFIILSAYVIHAAHIIGKDNITYKDHIKPFIPMDIDGCYNAIIEETMTIHKTKDKMNNILENPRENNKLRHIKAKQQFLQKYSKCLY